MANPTTTAPHPPLRPEPHRDALPPLADEDEEAAYPERAAARD